MVPIATPLIALCLEVATIRRRAFSGDFGRIEDTIGAVLMICIGIGRGIYKKNKILDKSEVEREQRTHLALLRKESCRAKRD